MMQRLIYAAAALLILQISLAVAFNTTDNNLKMTAPGSPFATFSPDAVSIIDISGDNEKHLVLERTGSGWILPGYFSTPADSTQIENLLNKLANAKKGFTVATTKEAARRFKTAEDNFERHIILKKGQTTVADFFMGTAAGFRHSHTRMNGQDEIFSLPLSSFEVAVDAEEWINRNLAKQDKSKLKRIEFTDMALIQNEKEWQLEGVTPEKTDKEEVNRFIDKICNLTIQGVEDPREGDLLFKDKPQITFTVTTSDNTRITYSLAKKEDYHLLKKSDSDLLLKVSSWQVEDLVAFTQEKFILESEKKQDGLQTEQAPENK